MLNMDIDRDEIAERVRRARVEKGWSKEEAARKAGISAITWKRIEDGLNVHDGKLSAATRLLDEVEQIAPEGVVARPLGDPNDDLVEFTVEGNFGVRAVVKGPVRDMDAMQAAVSKLISGMQVEESNKRATS
jgi:DNA-binding XRE family transcriptional regulator